MVKLLFQLFLCTFCCLVKAMSWLFKWLHFNYSRYQGASSAPVWHVFGQNEQWSHEKKPGKAFHVGHFLSNVPRKNKAEQMHAAPWGAKCWIINPIKIERFDWSNTPKMWKISQKIAFSHIFFDILGPRVLFALYTPHEKPLAPRVHFNLLSYITISSDVRQLKCNHL